MNFKKQSLSYSLFGSDEVENVVSSEDESSNSDGNREPQYRYLHLQATRVSKIYRLKDVFSDSESAKRGKASPKSRLLRENNKHITAAKAPAKFSPEKHLKDKTEIVPASWLDKESIQNHRNTLYTANGPANISFNEHCSINEELQVTTTSEKSIITSHQNSLPVNSEIIKYAKHHPKPNQSSLSSGERDVHVKTQDKEQWLANLKVSRTKSDVTDLIIQKCETTGMDLNEQMHKTLLTENTLKHNEYQPNSEMALENYNSWPLSASMNLASPQRFPTTLNQNLRQNERSMDVHITELQKSIIKKKINSKIKTDFQDRNISPKEKNVMNDAKINKSYYLSELLTENITDDEDTQQQQDKLPQIFSLMDTKTTEKNYFQQFSISEIHPEHEHSLTKCEANKTNLKSIIFSTSISRDLSVNLRTESILSENNSNIDSNISKHETLLSPSNNQSNSKVIFTVNISPNASCNVNKNKIEKSSRIKPMHITGHFSDVLCSIVLKKLSDKYRVKTNLICHPKLMSKIAKLMFAKRSPNMMHEFLIGSQNLKLLELQTDWQENRIIRKFNLKDYMRKSQTEIPISSQQIYHFSNECFRTQNLLTVSKKIFKDHVSHRTNPSTIKNPKELTLIVSDSEKNENVSDLNKSNLCAAIFHRKNRREKRKIHKRRRAEHEHEIVVKPTIDICKNDPISNQEPSNYSIILHGEKCESTKDSNVDELKPHANSEVYWSSRNGNALQSEATTFVTTTKRKYDAKSTIIASVFQGKRRKKLLEQTPCQSAGQSQNDWQYERKFLIESLSKLNIEKLRNEIHELLEVLTSLSKTPSIEVYFIINKIIVTFIYECLLSLDYSRITLRKYLSICEQAKKLQSKNIDNSQLSEVVLRYEELKTNTTNSNIISHLDLVLITLRKVKQNLFTKEWLNLNKTKIQRYMYVDPVEYTLAINRCPVTNKKENTFDKPINEKIVLTGNSKPAENSHSVEEGINSKNIKRKVSTISSSTLSSRNKFPDGLHCADVTLCDFVGEYGSTLGSSNLDFMPDEMKLDGPIIPFPQNSGNFNDILEQSLSEADVSSLSDNEPNENYFNNQIIDSSSMFDDGEIIISREQYLKERTFTFESSVNNTKIFLPDPDNSIETHGHIVENGRNLDSNPFWRSIISGGLECSKLKSVESQNENN